MDVEVEFGDDDSLDEPGQDSAVDPDEFLAKNSFRIVYQTNNFLLPHFRDMIENGNTINLRPEYQRRLRWSNIQKSKLIESLLLNIPIPPVFFFEADAAQYEVMDGQQRLNAIRDFFAGDFALNGLKVLAPLNGLRYTKCPPRIKRTLDRASMSAIVLLMESESELPPDNRLTLTDVRRLVFDRLNTGGKHLNAQEIRNALNPGPLNKLVIELSRFDLFTQTFGIPSYTEKHEEDFYENPQRQKNSIYSSMRDCELVLRFFALRREKNIRGSIKSMLDRAMEIKVTEEEAKQWGEDYRERFSFLYTLFDQAPFRITSKADQREKISAALYDASMIAIDRHWEKRADIQQDKTGVAQRLEEAVADENSYSLIVGRKNTAEAVRERIKLLMKILSPQ